MLNTARRYKYWLFNEFSIHITKFFCSVLCSYKKTNNIFFFNCSIFRFVSKGNSRLLFSFSRIISYSVLFFLILFDKLLPSRIWHKSDFFIVYNILSNIILYQCILVMPSHSIFWMNLSSGDFHYHVFFLSPILNLFFLLVNFKFASMFATFNKNNVYWL